MTLPATRSTERVFFAGSAGRIEAVIDAPAHAPPRGIALVARPQELPIVVIPGADHFFHRRLHLIRSIVKGAWRD